jgi:hypothetical protein
MRMLFPLFFSIQVFAFNLVGSSIATYNNPTIFVHVGDFQCPDFNDSPEDIMDYVREANERYWNRVSTSSLELKAGSIKNVASSYYTDQIENLPAVDEGILIVCNDNTTTFSTSGKLAVALPNNTRGSTIIGSVIAINSRAISKFNTLSRDEKVSVIAHEIGHTFGLGHSKFEDSLMYAVSFEKRRGLGRDDWDGASYLYPKEQGPAGLCGTISTNNRQSSNSLLALIVLFLLLNIALFRHQKVQ